MRCDWLIIWRRTYFCVVLCVYLCFSRVRPKMQLIGHIDFTPTPSTPHPVFPTQWKYNGQFSLDASSKIASTHSIHRKKLSDGTYTKQTFPGVNCDQIRRFQHSTTHNVNLVCTIWQVSMSYQTRYTPTDFINRWGQYGADVKRWNFFIHCPNFCTTTI